MVLILTFYDAILALPFILFIYSADSTGIGTACCARIRDPAVKKKFL
jgi:hypothetical protein